MIDWSSHFIEPPHPELESLKDSIASMVSDGYFDPTQRPLPQVPYHVYRYGYPPISAQIKDDPFAAKFLAPELDNHARAIGSRLRAYLSGGRSWSGDWRDEFVPDGWRTLRDDEYARWGDARLRWGAWTSVDASKRYGSNPPRPRTFGGPIIRPQRIRIRTDIANQEELF